MRETAMAFSPLVAVMYFVFFPSQLALCLQWLMRLVQWQSSLPDQSRRPALARNDGIPSLRNRARKRVHARLRGAMRANPGSQANVA